MKKINKISVNCTAIPLDLLEDNTLSWDAKGLAAYICYLDGIHKDFASKSIELWKTCVDTNSMDTYRELVNAGYIEDVIGLDKEEGKP